MIEHPISALSVRQPWAHAIIHLGKSVENRSALAISKGGMKRGRICIHASKGMTRDEYESALLTFAAAGVPEAQWPRPDALVRGGVIGVVDVVDIVKAHDSAWFCGPRALVLANAAALDAPIAGAGDLGYFDWRKRRRGDAVLEEPKPWMRAWPGTHHPFSNAPDRVKPPSTRGPDLFD